MPIGYSAYHRWADIHFAGDSRIKTSLKEETTSASTRADMAKRGFAISIVNEAIDFADVFAVM
jgi:hypothetical protein